MAKRLRDVCVLPESEPLWRAGRGFVVRDHRSAPVPGRSNVAEPAVIGLTGARSSQDIAAAGDGRTPPSSPSAAWA
jgi:hypothetical protein